jgi:hypothetical protein
MKKIKIEYCVIALFIMGLTKLNAQETVCVSGGNASGSGGAVNYTVGQMAYTSNSGTNSSLTQGVQQIYEVSVYTGLEEKSVNLKLSAYPNPTNGILILKVEKIENTTFTAQLFDANAKIIENFKLISEETNIQMNDKQIGVYLLKVFKNNNEIKSFKIINK